MATLDWECTRSGEVTLVELTVDSEFDQHVRIESELTPVWPPRRQGVPQTGWTGNTFDGHVSRDETLVFGYASPAEPVEPPAAIVATESPAKETSVGLREIVHTLGEPSPPRDTLKNPPSPSETPETSNAPSETPVTPTASQSGIADTPSGESGIAEMPTSETEPTAWFDAVEGRVATTERLAQTADAEDVRDAVADVGGIQNVRALQAQLDADRRQLAELQQRTETLSERLAAVELPLATLERIV